MKLKGKSVRETAYSWEIKLEKQVQGSFKCISNAGEL